MQKLPCPIAHHAHLHPNKIALEHGSITLSYAEAEAYIQRLQHYLQRILIPSKIGIIAHACMDTILLYFAALRENFSVCLISPKDPEHLIQEKVNELKLSALFTNSPSFNQKPPLAFSSLSMIDSFRATYLYTSGSSAKPKIACLSYTNNTYNALGLLDILKLTSDSRYLLSLPLNHVSGLAILFRSFLKGATIVIPKHPYDLASFIQEASITHLSLVSTQYLHLLKSLESSPKSLQCILLGGSAFSSNSLQEGLNKNLPLYLSYGLTEMSSTVCCNPLFETKDPSHTGYLLPYRNLKIEGNEILVGGETLFQGYYDIQTQKIHPREKWFSTNDLGSLKKKTLMLYGRKDRLIISGGENIQPEEIELALLNIKGIHKALVVSAPDETFGEKVIAIIQSDVNISSETLNQLLAESLPRYKLPKMYIPWPKHLLPESLKISNALKKEILAYIRLNHF